MDMKVFRQVPQQQVHSLQNSIQGVAQFTICCDNNDWHNPSKDGRWCFMKTGSWKG